MKKIVSLLLAAVLVTGMATMAFAANPKLTKQIDAIAGMDVGDQAPGTTIRLPLVKEAFEDATEDLTMTDVRNSKITVKQSVRSGSKAIDTVEIKAGTGSVACITVTLAETLASTKPLDFETTIYLYINNKKQSYSTVVTGTLTNDEIVVDSDTDYVDLSDGKTVVCEETASKVEVYLGNDVTLFVKMLKGKEYYGKVTTDTDSYDEETIDKYSDIEEVLTLTTINMNTSGNIVKIDNGSTYHVYDKDLKYLGKTSSMLPYSTKYYLSSKQLDVDTAEPEDEDFEEDEVIENIEEGAESETGETPEGDGVLNAVAPGPDSSKGNNPDTGAGPGLAIAIATGTLALIAMLAVGKRRHS